MFFNKNDDKKFTETGVVMLTQVVFGLCKKLNITPEEIVDIIDNKNETMIYTKQVELQMMKRMNELKEKLKSELKKII